MFKMFLLMPAAAVITPGQAISHVLVMLGEILLASFIIERGVEFLFGTVSNLLVGIFPGLSGLLLPNQQNGKAGPFRSGFIQFMAVIFGIFSAWIWKFDLFYLFAQLRMFLAGGADGEILVITTWGIVLTGIVIGMGSVFIHELYKNYFGKQSPVPLDELETFKAG
ncbi:hypothetical protein LARV_02659 [Longilinea arvoryzae]|uniref:Uncharacterized protein n=1 Tax=Longilinea arvoryzae TaxID=360412 RepID=A0A0S7BI86_9CHLR|nr:hypothetical protein [Longilinea arvoryzae]GAP14880.1 hypothetical protein LARV_02659 [Longilinea arvoryzae]